MFKGKKNSDGFSEWTEAGFKQAYEQEPPEPEKMIYVVAGTPKQASQFARKHGLYPKKWKSISDVNDLKGAVGTIFYVGSFYERQDLMKIKEEVAIGIQQGRLKVSHWDG